MSHTEDRRNIAHSHDIQQYKEDSSLVVVPERSQCPITFLTTPGISKQKFFKLLIYFFLCFPTKQQQQSLLWRLPWGRAQTALGTSLN